MCVHALPYSLFSFFPVDHVLADIKAIANYLAKPTVVCSIAREDVAVFAIDSPSSAWVFESELARASQRLDAAETRSQLAMSAVNLATTAIFLAKMEWLHVQRSHLVKEPIHDTASSTHARGHADP